VPQRRLSSESGFTLIELLVVVSILGVLAAIAIPAFAGQRGRAQDTAAKEYVRTAAIAIETFSMDRQTYAATAAELLALDPSLNDALGLAVTGTADTFTVSVDSVPGDNGGTFSLVRAADGSTRRTCANHGSGGCRDAADASGNWW
jgi:prepilin-type N-terminal cleavage/methylation domain-containing protein